MTLLFAIAIFTLGADSQVARWDFGQEETSRLTPQGGVHRDVPGPRPPTFPDFEPGNTGVKLDGKGARLVFEDPGNASSFDFSNGDAITLEAWVQVDEIGRGENSYVIGKGRTGAPNFAADNQNWALRVREQQGKVSLSFLFATPKVRGNAADAHWHRWTTEGGFTPGKAWHYLAVSYRFGDPSTIRGWIDGKPVSGRWDMGGATAEAPLVDDDAIWIGSALNGSASNSFRGSLDAIAIHRDLLTDSAVQSRYRREGVDLAGQLLPEVMPDLGPLPAGRVIAQFHEGMPAHIRWLEHSEEIPPETLRRETDAFLMDRLPRRHDAWGIRDAWKAPVLARFAADVPLPPGKHTFLMRVRGLSRLWVDGLLIARSKPLTGSPSGEEPMTPVAVAPKPGLRIAEHRQQEIRGEANVGEGGTCRVVLETIVGGKAFRTDPGEMLVAVESSDGSSFRLLAGSESAMAPLTDVAVTAALARQEAAWLVADDRDRRLASASQDEFWQNRHAAARVWAHEHPAPAIPEGASHPVDAFLAAKINRAREEAARSDTSAATEFHATVLPILRDACFRCHGEKTKGGLKLDSRAAALAEGDSGSPAVVPGNLEDGELLARIRSDDPDERMPPGAKGLEPAQVAALERWIEGGANWPALPLDLAEVEIPPTVDDAAFLRRATFDVIGLPATEEEIRAFLADTSTDKHKNAIDRLLADERRADHAVAYWQDVLAENPTLLNSSLNTTGPFRYFLHDAFRDGKAFDRLVTELILLRGGPHDGGSAGFGLAGDNDAPFAAKGQIVAGAFLGVELQCARCHDSPYHSTKQADLYALAAMFERKPAAVPKTSRVPAAFFESKGRESLIKVTMKPDQAVPPTWPFPEMIDGDIAFVDSLMRVPEDSRERFAAIVTSPTNTRFAKVVANRIWRRLVGAGIVEPPHDWEGKAPSHPDLLEWLAHEFVSHDYDLNHLIRLVLTSEVYRRQATGHNRDADADRRFFAAPDRRRLTAEQVVDALCSASGRPMDVEELTFDPDGRRPANNRTTLGVPSRAWMFTNLSTERDRPSLTFPKASAIGDILDAFGWSGDRQNPRTDRETAPNVLQPGSLANGRATQWLTRAARGGTLAELALTSGSPEEVVDRIFLRYVSRLPGSVEKAPLIATLAEGFADRVASDAGAMPPRTFEVLPKVTWSNHLRPESTPIALEMDRRARLGPEPDPRLRPEWREAFEDVIWSVVNTREFVWLP